MRSTGVVAATVALAAAGCGGAYVYRPVPPAEVLATRGWAWVHRDTQHFSIHVLERSPLANRAGVVAARAEASWRRVAWILGGEPADTSPIHVFVLGTPSDVRRIAGFGVNGLAYPETGVVLGATIGDWDAASAPHEIAHVLAYRHFGKGGIATGYGGLALGEGLAVYAQETWHGEELHQATRRLRAEGKGLNLADLMQVARPFSEQVVYPQAGSCVRFLREAYGAERLRAFLGAQAASPVPRFEAIYGLAAAELDAAWSAAIETAAMGGAQ